MFTSFRKGFVAALTVTLLAATASASVPGQFPRTYQVTGPVELEVLTHSGDIIVRGGPAGTVSVSGKIHAGNNWLDMRLPSHQSADVQELEKNPPIRQNGNSIHIDYVNMRNISIDYEITVPENTKVHNRTGSGDQTLENLHGNFDLESGSGRQCRSFPSGFTTRTRHVSRRGRRSSVRRAASANCHSPGTAAGCAHSFA